MTSPPPEGRIVACWSVKGGSGTTVVAAALGLLIAQLSSQEALLVDLGGDLPTVFGDRHSAESGVHDWLEAEAGAEALDSLTIELGNGLNLIPRGRGRASAPAERLVEALRSRNTPVVVDCGRADDGLGLAIAAAAPMSLLVMRPCFLALRRAAESPVRPTGIVLVEEPGHPLRHRDIAESLGLAGVTRVAWHPIVAKAVDTATLARRLPRALTQGLRPLAEDVLNSRTPNDRREAT